MIDLQAWVDELISRQHDLPYFDAMTWSSNKKTGSTTMAEPAKKERRDEELLFIKHKPCQNKHITADTVFI